MSKQFNLCKAAILMAAVSLATVTHAALIVENFDYGESSGNLVNFGSAGGGWAGGWTGNTAPNYSPTLNLTYTAPGYNNLDNDASTGSAVRNGGNAASVATRDFSDTLDGTVWVSALAYRTATNQHVLLWLRGDGSTSNFISIRNTGAVVRIAGNDTTQSTHPFALDETNLFLARVTLNQDAGDRIDFWINPDLSGGEAGLGIPTVFRDTGTIGNALTGIGVSFENDNATLDAIRISNDPNGFEMVTAIPEPGTLALMGIALGSLVLFRRRR
ncbi:MAG: PEP-CTERM sorting domain-containing protein [Verrucomicrobia bacterium]|nr:PEP-CTERM sorting domain-containing protein [Verrucomicrobiota bacterium]MCH8527318.1 PEP-CTERM sorting domain-containing protein [Kiritimatiellia bacterium]